jgi:predicted kinase
VSNNRLYVLVAGPPASGKSTLAPRLAEAMALPLIAKDTIKEALMRTLPVPDVDASRRIGRAAVQVMLAVAAESPLGAVLESNFYRSYATPELRALPGSIVEVFCRCPPEVRLGRYRERADSRALGHFDTLRTDAELVSSEISEPVAGGWPVIEVDTTVPVELPGLVARVRSGVSG